MNIDFSFLNWEIVRAYVASGFIFSIQLTLIAMVGGIALGTLLALARLSGRKAFEVPATIYVDTLRSIPLVMVLMWFFLLIPFLIGRSIGAYDLLKGFESVGRNFNRPVETTLLAAAVYFVICFSLSMLVKQLQRRIQIIR